MAEAMVSYDDSLTPEEIEELRKLEPAFESYGAGRRFKWTGIDGGKWRRNLLLVLEYNPATGTDRESLGWAYYPSASPGWAAEQIGSVLQGHKLPVPRPKEDEDEGQQPPS